MDPTTNVEKITPKVAKIAIKTFCLSKSFISTCRAPANNKKDNIPPIKALLKSTLSISEIEKEITLGLIYPEKNTIEDKISESPIRPIVGGSFIYLKFIYISKAESVTNIDDISNTFIGYYK
tara:strand:- start:1069 stop:1434 length:366 start_codon:yes stop_codon:yes gene_type:complete